MVRSIIALDPPEFSSVVYHMFGAGKKQAGAEGFSASLRSATFCTEPPESARFRPSGNGNRRAFAACKIRSPELVRIYTVCYMAWRCRGECHDDAGEAEAIQDGTRRKRCSASCFRHA